MVQLELIMFAGGWGGGVGGGGGGGARILMTTEERVGPDFNTILSLKCLRILPAHVENAHYSISMKKIEFKYHQRGHVLVPST